ncbi:MAG TPA: metalloregulator ArsR/SmtB family transcription factor [Longimicrobiales bacterium]|nr:metalloregulator ArsR/SmtB family transcription factor [Longimicrobiales bacterium]
MTPDQRDIAARLGGVLAHPLRLAILECLVEGARIVSDLIEALDEPQPVISKHLGILRDAGLLECEADGRCRLYRLADEGPVRRVLSAIADLAAGTQAQVAARAGG